MNNEEGKPIDFESGELKVGDKINIHNYLNNEWKVAVVQEIDLGEREILVNYNDDSQEWISVDGRKICYLSATVDEQNVSLRKKINIGNMMTRHRRNSYTKNSEKKDKDVRHPTWNDEEIAKEIREIVNYNDDSSLNETKKETMKTAPKESKPAPKIVTPHLPFLRVKFKKTNTRFEMICRKRDRQNQLRKRNLTSTVKSEIKSYIEETKIVTESVPDASEKRSKDGKRVSVLPKKYQDMERPSTKIRIKFSKNDSNRNSESCKKVKKPITDTEVAKKAKCSNVANKDVIKTPLSAEINKKNDEQKCDSISFDDDSSINSSPFIASAKKKIKTLLPRRNTPEIKPFIPNAIESTQPLITVSTPSPITSMYPILANSQLSLPSGTSGFICPKQDCKMQLKFRNENLLMMHIKHYHQEYRNMLSSIPNVADFAYARTVGESIDSPQSRFLHQIVQLEEDKLKEKSDVESEIQTSADTTLIREKSMDESSTVLGYFIPSPQMLDQSNNKQVKTNKKSTPKKLVNITPSTSKISVLLAQLKEPPLVPPSISIQSDHTDTTLSLSQNSSALHSPEIEERLQSNSNSPTAIDGQLSVKDSVASKKRKLSQLDITDVINCICGYGYEDGLMMQCDLCLCWQHGSCNVVEDVSEVLENYVCDLCQNARRVHSSKKYCYVQNWLKLGKIPQFDFSKPNDETLKMRENYFKQTCNLLCSLRDMKNAIHSVQVKIHILKQTSDHPKLYLWAKSWNEQKNAEKENQRISDDGPVPEAAINMAACRKNLSEHIDEEMNKVELMLEIIEDQIDNLENVEDDKFGKEPERYRSVAKQTLLMLIRDMSSIQKLKYSY